MSQPVLFWDVDTQHDFMDPQGRLRVPGACTIVRNLRRLTQAAVAGHVPIVASADSHPPDDPEFEQFAPHCVAGTPGQQKIIATQAEPVEVAAPARIADQVGRLMSGELAQLVLEKQQLDVFSLPYADAVLDLVDPDHVFVYGVTTEYCVLQAVMGLRRHERRVSVVTDAVKAIDEIAGRRALERMREAGADFTDTSTVLRSINKGAEHQ